MMDALIVWAAFGPILAFVAGAIVIACWDDDEDETPPLLDYLRRTDGTTFSVPKHTLSFDIDSRSGSCLQCGRRGEWP